MNHLVESDMSDFGGLDETELYLFFKFCRMIGVAVGMHLNDNAGAVSMDDLIKEYKYKKERFGDKISDKDIVEACTFLLPCITRFGFQKMQDNEQFGYGIMFTVVVRTYRDTTGLGDAIEVHVTYGLRDQDSKETGHKRQICFEESPQERCNMTDLKKPISLLRIDEFFNDKYEKAYWKFKGDREAKIWAMVEEERAKEKESNDQAGM